MGSKSASFRGIRKIRVSVVTVSELRHRAAARNTRARHDPLKIRTPRKPREGTLSDSAVIIRPATLSDFAAIRALHISVATRSGGIARYADEITDEHVNEFMTRSLRNGVIVVAEDSASRAIVGELHTYPYGVRRLAHVLTSLTIVVSPDAQARGIGRRLFESLLREVRENRPDILRVELIVQESNPHARRLYESVGFRVEGRLTDGIMNTSTGIPETDLPMAWLRRSAV